MDLRERAVLVLCADNGVVCQGVTQSPSSVTAIVTEKGICYPPFTESLAALFEG